jgi:MFS family permease
MLPRYRLALAAFGSDLALYLIMLSLPYRLLGLGASSLVLGTVPLFYSGPYSVLALGAGRISDRWPRRGPIRAGLSLAVLAALALHRAGSAPAILGSVALIGIGLGFFWPSVQAGMSEIEKGANLESLTGIFNIGWSCGKGLGLLAGGLLLSRIGGEGLALVAAACWVGCALVLPAMDRPGDHSQTVLTDPRRPDERRQRAFLRSAWIANGMGFAIAATLNHHLPRLLLREGIEADNFGVFLGLVFFAQGLVFLIVGRMRWWHYRFAPLAAMQLLMILGVTWVRDTGSVAFLMALAPAFGIGMGFCYQSSLYYSLHAVTGRGRQAGIHEATLGVSSATVPLVGGSLVAGHGLQAPFVVAGAAMAASLILGWVWIARSPAQPPTASSSTTVPPQ